MSNKKDEVWYCVNSKGHKIAPYGDSYPVAKPKNRLERILNFIGVVIGLFLFIALTSALLSSCNMTRLTADEYQAKREDRKSVV